jgi:hypothetical protein
MAAKNCTTHPGWCLRFGIRPGQAKGRRRQGNAPCRFKHWSICVNFLNAMCSWRPDVSLINSRVDIYDETLPLVLPAGCDIRLYLTIDAHAVRHMQRWLVGLWPDILKVNPEEEAERRLNLPGLVPGASVERGWRVLIRQDDALVIRSLTTSFDRPRRERILLSML